METKQVSEVGYRCSRPDERGCLMDCLWFFEEIDNEMINEYFPYSIALARLALMIFNQDLSVVSGVMTYDQISP